MAPTRRRMRLRLAGLAGFAAVATAFASLTMPSQTHPVVATRWVDSREELAPAAAPKPAMALPVDAAFVRYSRLVDEASRAHGVDGALVHAIILAESSYDPEAVSAVGATGLMQLMPATAREHGVSDPFDPAKNIHGGVKHLKGLLVRFDGDVELALAAYNAGPGAVIRAGYRIPPNPETTAFVPKVIGYQRNFTRRSAPPSAAAIPSPGTR